MDSKGWDSCQLRLKWKTDDQPGELLYPVKLIGTKDPSIRLVIESDPRIQGQWLTTTTSTSELTQYYMGEHMTSC